MFSGIIAAVGRITHLTTREAGFRLHIEAGKLGLDDVALGDSIACNGVCLTVVDRQKGCFFVDVSPESLACTVGLVSTITDRDGVCRVIDQAARWCREGPPQGT